MYGILKRALAAAMSVFMIGGVMTCYSPLSEESAIVAEAADCYVFNNGSGLLTLKGNVNRFVISDFAYKENVKKIVAQEGTVMPQNCSNMFGSYSNCTTIDLSNADLVDVQDMTGMCIGCSSLTTFKLSNFSVGNYTDTSYMFSACFSLTTLDLRYLNTSYVTDMRYMFSGCSSLTSLDLSTFKTSNVTDMSYMFYKCSSLLSLDLKSFNTSNVTNMRDMFSGCSSLKTLDLSSFNTRNVSYSSDMFAGTNKLQKLVLGANFGDIGTAHYLPNPGWANANNPTVRVSGDGEYAEISNNGTNTYVRCGEIKINYQDKEVYYTPGDEFVRLRVDAESTDGDKLKYIWYQWLPDSKKWMEVDDTATGQYDMNFKYGLGREDDGTMVRCVVESTYFTKTSDTITLRFRDNGSIRITKQPPEVVYFDTGSPARVSAMAVGRAMIYSWYFKTPDRTSFLPDEEFEADEWAGSYDFYGTAGPNGLTDRYDGTEMYVRVHNKWGAEAESNHFILKKYKGSVDRNVSIRLPNVGETYAHYIADSKSIVPAELILDKEVFGIYELNVNGNHEMKDTDVFKAGSRYEYCLKMSLPEYVSPGDIYTFYGRSLIVNGVENTGADVVYEEDGSFIDYWTTPVLEGPLDIKFSHNVSLENDLSIVYYVPADKLTGFTDISLNLKKEVFDENGKKSYKTSTIKAGTPTDSGYGPEYTFRFKGIAAKEMGSSVTATITAKKNGKTFTSQEDVYSIKQYAMNKLNKTGTPNSLKTLLVDMLNYGAQAQQYFKYNTGDLVNKSLTAQQKKLATPFDSISVPNHEKIQTLSGAKAKFTGKNLNLGSTTAIVYYMTFNSGVATSKVKLHLTYKNVLGESKTVDIPYSKFTKGDYANELRCDFTGLAAKDSMQAVTAVIQENGKNISDTLIYSIPTYASKKLANSSTNANLKDIIKSMLVYYTSAKNHFT